MFVPISPEHRSLIFFEIFCLYYRQPDVVAMMAAKWAVLVGINEYPPGNKRVDRNGNPLRFTDLRGCLNDVNQIEQYLLNSQGFDKSHILKLTSPLQSMDQFPDNRDPTAENIRDTLKSCTTQVKEGDIVYFHYSGHGARIKTLSPEGAKKGRLDECLVPFDVLRGGSFLRDFELVYLLRQIASKGAFLTVTVDCCHSGGTAQRGSDRLVRGIDEVIDNLETDQPLIDHSGQEEEISLRNAVSTLHPKRYALHAACGADEKAYETRKYGEWIGLFTHWLLHSLEEAGSDSTHRMISDNISIKVQDQFFDQKPVFTGKIDHYFMGPESETPRGMGDLKLSNVPTTVQQGATATILGGRAQWVSTGDEFAIFPWNEKGSDTSQRLAVVKATVVKELESEAKFEEVTHNPKFKIESGCRAIRIKKNALIQLIVANTSLYWELDSALRSFEHSAIPLRLSLNRDDRDENLAFYNACYEVEASSNPPGRYHLQLESGQEISFLPDATNPTEILEQAEHVGTFHMIRELRSQEDPGTKNQFEFIAADIGTLLSPHVVGSEADFS